MTTPEQVLYQIYHLCIHDGYININEASVILEKYVQERIQDHDINKALWEQLEKIAKQWGFDRPEK